MIRNHTLEHSRELQGLEVNLCLPQSRATRGPENLSDEGPRVCSVPGTSGSTEVDPVQDKLVGRDSKHPYCRVCSAATIGQCEDEFLCKNSEIRYLLVTFILHIGETRFREITGSSNLLEGESAWKRSPTLLLMSLSFFFPF